MMNTGKYNIGKMISNAKNAAEAAANIFQPGDKVRNNFGKTLTVQSVSDYQVFVEEECNGWYHPTKLSKVS